jgi:kanamycin kinase/aminoglycoside 3'-phosphotransferase-3
MFDLTKLPTNISRRISGLTWSFDKVGKSGSTILLFDEMVLKIEKISRSSENDIKLLVWLDGKLPVPKIFETETQDGYSFLLMSRLPGEMACSDNSLQSIEATVRALANGLKMLWQIDISDCPCLNVVSDKMSQAKHNIENNHVNTDDFEPETFGLGEFKDIPDLYEYLDRNRPKEDCVFSHGDFCLPNVFVFGCDIAGFLDWGNGGIADRWQDIALCIRSLRHNYVECAGYGESEYQRYKALLYRELDIEPDEEKIRYYILLDELF